MAGIFRSQRELEFAHLRKWSAERKRRARQEIARGGSTEGISAERARAWGKVTGAARGASNGVLGER